MTSAHAMPMLAISPITWGDHLLVLLAFIVALSIHQATTSRTVPRRLGAMFVAVAATTAALVLMAP